MYEARLSPASCRFKTAKCHNCQKIDHIKNACKVPRTSNDVKQVVQDDTDGNAEYTLFTLNSPSSRPFQVPVMVNNQKLVMELDTGAAISLLSEETYHKLWPDKALQQTTTVLWTYSGEQLVVCGCMEAEVVYGLQCYTLPLFVVKGNGPSLLGRDWLNVIKLDWKEIQTLQKDTLAQHKEAFQEGLSTLKGYNVKIH